MSREQALEFVSQLEEAVNTHDTARLMGFYADEAVTVSPVFTGISGRTAIAKSWNDMFALFPDWTVAVTDVLVDGDRIVFMGTAGATDQHGWFGEPATHERIEYRAIIILTMAKGKIVRDERIYDLASVLQRLEKTRLDKELRMAAEVQRVLLSRAIHSTPFCVAAGDSIPCRAIGGDFFELMDLPSGDFGIALGDVAGKGPASALVAAMIQGMLAVEVQTEASPAAVLTHLNRLLLSRGLEPRFVTLIYGVLSPDGRFVYANGGHNPPILLARDGPRQLTVGGSIVGAFQAATFQEETIYLSYGDSLIAFSDGVTEASDAAGEEFGEERLMSFATSCNATSAPEMLQGILKRVEDFCAGTTQADDITLTVTRFQRP
jgi:serine phosphatase RsbU (regulator of sigma subunit)